MADQKVSGLSPVAAFANTLEFPVNDSGTSKKITGTQLKAAFPNGTLGYAQVTANQGSLVAVQTDLTSLSVTTAVLASGRRLRITGYVAAITGTVVGDSASLFIMEGAAQLSQANSSAINPPAPGIVCMAVVTPSAAAHTYKLAMIRSSGTGTLTMNATATAPAFILVEDIGV